MNITIITGATGGLGKEFVSLLMKEPIDQIWTIARNEQKLENLKKEFGDKIISIPCDLSDKEQIHSIEKRLQESGEKITVKYLINNAGLARMGSYKDFKVDEIEDTITVNCDAVATLCTICIPYMKEQSRIINMASQSSFQPVAYLNLYAATKAFVRSYTRALNLELKRMKTGITATVSCPGWVDTDLLLTEVNGHKVDFPCLVSAKRVAEQTLKDAKKGKDMSVCTFYVKAMHVMAKLFPQRWVMNTWIRDIKKYVD